MNHKNFFLTFRKCYASKLVYLLHLKNIRQQYKNNKLKIIATTWNDEIELLDGSCLVSDIQDYINCIIKKHETLFTNPPIHVYINRIINRLVFEIKNGYKMELQTPETVKKN